MWSGRGHDTWWRPLVLTQENSDPAAPRLSVVEAESLFVTLEEKGLIFKSHNSKGEIIYLMNEVKEKEWGDFLKGPRLKLKNKLILGGLTLTLALTIRVYFKSINVQINTGSNGQQVQVNGGQINNVLQKRTVKTGVDQRVSGERNTQIYADHGSSVVINSDDAKMKISIKATLDKLSDFYDMGDRVKGECTDPNKQYSLNEFNNDYQDWMKNTKEFLENDPNLGKWYSVQFDKFDPKDSPGDRVPPSTAPKDRSNSFPDIIRRMENLQNFHDELVKK